MKPAIPTSRKEFLAASCATLKNQLRTLASNKFTLRIPRILESQEIVSGLHLHPLSEISVQIVGVSHMHFVRQIVVSKPGEFLLIPSGMAHHEIVAFPKKPFLNMVVRFHN